jgi:ATP-dependent Clp protease adaptor protein ClpS
VKGRLDGQDAEGMSKPMPRLNNPSDGVTRSVPSSRRAGDDDRGNQNGTVIERRTKEQVKTRKPPLYKCILLNDDYTPMEFVVEILKSVFHRTQAEATGIMLHVHQNGMGVAGIFPYEVAETKIRAVEELAKENQFPLKCVMEKE